MDTILTFATPAEWEKWLEKNHTTSSGVWVRFYKKNSGMPTFIYGDILDAALCYGWIDTQAKGYDEKSWLVRFTPRRPKSVWSQRNVANVTRLMQLGKMKPAGFAQIESAKADGRWDKAYASQATMKMPEDFMQELKKNKKAYAFFQTLNKTNTYAIYWRLHTAKKLETRKKRMEQFIEMLNKEEKIHP
jgi:uncharacterized protein YdeI (YjbR/CyaY-like superfamily)